MPIAVMQSADDARRAVEREKATDEFNSNYLDIQRQMANDSHQQAIAAWTAAGLVFVETIIAGAALIYLRKTYVETRRTAVASLRSAHMARKSANIAKNALGSGRAWLTAVKVNPTIARPFKTLEGQFNEAVLLSVGWNNSGDTPALHVEMLSKYSVLPMTSIDYPKFEPALWSDPAGVQYSNGVIGPKAIVDGVAQVLLGAELERFLRHEVKVILYSAVKYSDIFQPDIVRKTEVCYEVFARTIVPDQKSRRPIQITVDALQVGPQNTAT